MAGDDPPFLTVGTAVSAKYRGAFCEAKVKVVKKVVKCKVKFKTGPGVVVNDDFIKGPLKIGAVVEAKQTENGSYEQGTIMKLNDASLYTVVFDDGDEKTLRRTLLCLQGEKHFHESETLDHLPLTDPENFGTPVMKKQIKKRNRRSSNRSQSDDDDEDDEEDEEESDSDSAPKKQRKEEPEDAVGKVVIVEFNEKRKNSLFPALVVDPSCTKDVQMKGKDQVVVRSFKDNKYYTVAKSSRKPFLTKDHTYKGDIASLKSATEKAVTFIDTGQLPSNWDLDILKKKTKQGHIDSVEDTSEDSSDDEYDMEKDAWLASLHKFMEERATPINKPPVLGFRDLNLYKLYKLVKEHGGCRKVTDKQLWRNIMTKMGIPVSTSPQPYNIHTAYNKYLMGFEEFNRKMGPNPRVFTRTRRRSFDRGWITPGIIQRHQSSSKQEIKDEPSDKDDDREEDTPKKRKKVTRKKEKEEDSRIKPEPEESKETKDTKETKRETRDSKSRVRDNNEGEEAEPSDKEDRRTPKRASREEKVTKDRLSRDERGKDKEKEEDGSSSRERASREERNRERLKEEKTKERGGGGSDEKSEEKSGVDERGKDKLKDGRGKEGAEDDKLTPGKTATSSKGKEKKPKIKGEGSKEDVCKSPEVKTEYEIGEKVLVHYGRGRTEKIYEAKVVDIEVKGKEHVFTVHYTGWNTRYDEAVKKSRIVGSAEKKKKKVTSKGKSDKDSSKKDSDRRDKEEQDRKKKDEEKKEQEEMEAKAREAKELKERQEKEKQEKEKVERERQEKDRREKERKERERREKVEKDRLEKEQKEKQEKARRELEERERKEKTEREKKEKEHREKQEKERQEREKKEKQEREKKEKQEREKKEKQDREKQEKEERDRREKEKADQERRNKEAAEKAKESEKEKKEKEKLAKEGKRTPSGKRGRPSLNKASPVAPSPPRSAPTLSRGNKSPSPASVFSQRSMRSDRKSLNESPFASGLYVRSRSTRSSTGDKRSQDSDSDAEDADDQSESQQSTHESEDSSKAKDGRVLEQDEARGTGKTEAPAATLIKVSEQKPTTFDEDSDDGPPTLTAQVSLVDAPDSQLQDVGMAGTAADLPKTDIQKSTGEDQEVGGRSRSKKDSSKLRVRKTQDREKDVSREAAADLPSSEKQSTKQAKENKEEEVGKKIEETPVLERQVPMEMQLKEKLEEIKQEDKDSISDADKAPEKRKGRKKGRKSLESRKRAKTETEPDTATKPSTTATETFEPKRKQAKMDRRKSDKGGRKKQNEQDSRLPTDNADSDLVSSSMEEKSLAGTSKSFMTTPPTTPEGSPKMPSSPSQEDLILKGEEQSSNKSDSDALIEVASIDDKEAVQTPNINSSVIGPATGATQLKATPTPTTQDPSPKKRRRGASESEPGKKRRKRSQRRKSSLSERRHPGHQDRGNSSDTDESRSDSRLMSSASKHHFVTEFSEIPSSNLSDSANCQKQRRWNFLVDLSSVKEPDERIAIIQRNLKELRSVYTRLKQEVATIDRRRKKFRKKEREAAQVMAGVGLGCLSQGTEKPESIVS